MFIVHFPVLLLVIYTSFTPFRLARGSILASIIGIMFGGPLKIGALYVSGLFGVLYVVIIDQYIWVCETNIEPTPSRYVLFFESPFRILLTLL
jgi:hypothetical protein